MSDLYNLGHSIEKSIIQPGEEIRIDLSLNENEFLNTGTITGTVTDENDNPIKGALIKVLNTNNDPLYHALTDANGVYTITGIQPSSALQIQAVLEGYLLEVDGPFTIAAGQTITFNETLATDPSAIYSTIAGHVTDPEGKPVEGLTAALVKEEGGIEEVVGLAATNEYGQYVFTDVENGKYIVRLTGEGYETQETGVTVSQPGSIANVNTMVIPAPGQNLGTINGIITDDKGSGVEGATVILYEVTEEAGEKKYTAVRYTKTSIHGIYLFGSVPQGDYIIKANKEQ